MRTYAFTLLLCGAGASAQAPAPSGKLLRPGVDSLAVFLINGADTTRTGSIRDELAIVQMGGRQVLRRVYSSNDRVLGARVDTLVDDAESLKPILHRSRTSHGQEFLSFGDGRVSGWTRLANGDSVSVDVALDDNAYNSSAFDLVLRAAPLTSKWTADVPSFLAGTRTVVPLQARVVGSEVVGGEDSWRIQANFGGTPVTFWVGQKSRRLNRQLMQFRPDQAILFAPPTVRASNRAT